MSSVLGPIKRHPINMSVEAQYKNVNLCTKGFWPELGLPSQRQMLSYQTKSILAKMFTEKKRVKVQSTTCHYATKRKTR